MADTGLKVYGTYNCFVRGFPGHQQARAVVAARSFAAASRAFEAAGLDKLHKDYTSTSGNKHDLAAALARPGVVFVSPLDVNPPEFRAYGASDE